MYGPVLLPGLVNHSDIAELLAWLEQGFHGAGGFTRVHKEPLRMIYKGCKSSDLPPTRNSGIRDNLTS